MVKQIFKPYTKWEDYLSGMYSVSRIHKVERDGKVKLCVNLLSNDCEFYNACIKVIQSWTIASKVHLTNKDQNRRAWLGAAACCIHCGAQEILTREAWSLLTDLEKTKANIVADNVIESFINSLESNAQTEFTF